MHTHSTYAVAWAARGEEIPCVITGMADEFGGPIPVGPFAIIGDDSIGRGIVETLRGPPLARRADAEPRSVHDRRVARGMRSRRRSCVEDAARTVHIARQAGPLIPIPQDGDRRALRPLPERLRAERGRAPMSRDIDAADAIRSGRTALGIELGSTRIKACLVDADDPATVLAVGAHEWENQLRRRALDLLARRGLGRTARRLRRPRRRCRAAPRRPPGHLRRHRRLGDDARLPGLRRRRRAARAVPHLAQHLDRAALRPS